MKQPLSKTELNELCKRDYERIRRMDIGDQVITRIECRKSLEKSLRWATALGFPGRYLVFNSPFKGALHIWRVK